MGYGTDQTLPRISRSELVTTLMGAEANDRFAVSDLITPDDIRGLCGLTREYGLFHSDGRLIAQCGDNDNFDFTGVEIARCFLHTHPKPKAQGLLAYVSTPSYFDILRAWQFGDSVRCLLADHIGGITEFRGPHIDPDTRKEISNNVDVRDLLCGLLEKNGHNKLARSQLPRICSDSQYASSVEDHRNLLAQIVLKTATEVGAIVQRAGWDDVEDLANFMLHINLAA